MDQRRRQLLVSLGTAGVAALAGCNGSGGDGTETDAPSGDTPTDAAGPGTPTTTPTQQVHKLVAGDGDDGDQFGSSVAVSDDGATVLVGAWHDDDPNGEYAGSAYVFERSDGSWRQTAKLAPEDGEAGDNFGGTVGSTWLSGDGTTAIITAIGDWDPNGDGAGSAYVFERSDDAWEQRTKLAPDDGDDGDSFGTAVGVSTDGSTVVVSAYGDEDPNGRLSGSAYVFERSDDAWEQRAKLAPDDGDSYDRFGLSVGLSADGDTALVSAYLDENPNGERAGAAYVFERSDGSWSQTAKLAPDDGDDGDEFGVSVGLSADGSTAAVGAYGDEDPNGERAGSAYVFERSDGFWSQTAKLAPDDGDDGDEFGRTVAVTDDGATALVSAVGEEDPNGDRAGAVYAFESSSDAWSQRAKLVPDDGDDGDQFGRAVAVAGEGTVVVSAVFDEDPNGERAGAAYVFE